MKKICLIAMLLFALLLAACGNTEAPGNAGIANPMTEADPAQIASALNLDITLPEGAEEAAYYIIDDMAQADFLWNSNAVTYRMQSAEEYQDISGMYYDWGTVTQRQVGEENVTICCIEGGPGFCGWYDGASSCIYNISMSENATGDLLLELATAFIQ